MLGTEHVLIAAGAAFAGIIGKSLQLRWKNGNASECPPGLQREHGNMLIRHDQVLFGDMGVVKTLKSIDTRLGKIEDHLIKSDG